MVGAKTSAAPDSPTMAVVMRAKRRTENRRGFGAEEALGDIGKLHLEFGLVQYAPFQPRRWVFPPYGVLTGKLIIGKVWTANNASFAKRKGRPRYWRSSSTKVASLALSALESSEISVGL